MIYADTLAVDIGGTFIKYGVVGPDGTIRNRHKVPSPEEGSAASGDTELFFDYLCENMGDLTGVRYIGVSSPGLVDREFNVKSYAAPRLSALYGSNIRAQVEKRTGIQTAAINDARAAGLCELKMGRAKGTNLSAFLIIGTGGGGCICTKDDVFAGADNFAGEFHFLSYVNEKTGEDMKSGRVIGMFGLVGRYNARAAAGRQVTLGKTVIDRCFAGEELARELVADWIHRVALQCLNIIVLVNPELLCIGGGISEESWFMDAVKAEYEKICESHFAGAHFLTTRIEPCMYRNDANLLGAALKANACFSMEE